MGNYPSGSDLPPQLRHFIRKPPRTSLAHKHQNIRNGSDCPLKKTSNLSESGLKPHPQLPGVLWHHTNFVEQPRVKGSVDIGTATSGLPTRLVPHRESLCHPHRPRLEQGPCADSPGFVPIAELNSNGAVPANSDQIARQGLCQWPSLKQWAGSTRDCLQTKKDPKCVEPNDPVYFQTFPWFGAHGTSQSHPIPSIHKPTRVFCFVSEDASNSTLGMGIIAIIPPRVPHDNRAYCLCTGCSEPPSR